MKIDVYLFTSKERKDGKHPVVIRLMQDRKRKYKFVSNHYYYKQEWDFKRNLPKKATTKVTNYLTGIRRKYLDKISELEDAGLDVSFDALIDAVESKKSPMTVLLYFDKVIDRMNNASQIGNSRVYKGIKNIFEEYLLSAKLSTNLKFAEVDLKFLMNFKEYLNKNGLKDTTISNYTRTLGALYNKAIDDGYAKEANYPFRKFRKKIQLDLSTKKKAITSADIEAIKKIEYPEWSMKFEAQLYFLFGFYAGGINFIDIARLKWTDIQGSYLYYQREKTKRKKTLQKIFKIPLTNERKQIIELCRPKTGIDIENYIFPILNRHIHKTENQKYDRIRKVITRVNKDLKDVGQDAKIDQPLSTYVWRHSFATIARNEKNFTTAQISQAMGHSSVQVTETYLGQFDESVEEDLINSL